MHSEPDIVSVIAVDLGATSGRVMLGTVGAERLEIQEILRFRNVPGAPDGTLRWDVIGLWTQILDGLSLAARGGPEIASIGVDAWGVDYGLIRRGTLLANPVHYRDARHRQGVKPVHERMDHREQYERSGTQFLEINTIYQLAADRDLAALADTALLIPSLFSHWLGGTKATERTIASTTGLMGLDGAWDAALLAASSIPSALLPPIVAAGTPLGRMADYLARRTGFDTSPAIIAVAAHDTASAVLAAPLTSHNSAFISCGTWGLIGVETSVPVTSDAARRGGFTNETAANGGYLLHHNTMGLGFLNDACRQWAREGREVPLHDLLDQASRADGPVTIVDLDDPVFTSDERVEIRLADWCARHGAAAPSGDVEITRCIIESLANAFANAVAAIGVVAERAIDEIHIVGGGSLNTLLCERLAAHSRLPVIAGPAEAAAIGNVLIQGRTAGVIGDSTDEMRQLVRRCHPPTVYLPASSTTDLPQGAL